MKFKLRHLETYNELYPDFMLHLWEWVYYDQTPDSAAHEYTNDFYTLAVMVEMLACAKDTIDFCQLEESPHIGLDKNGNEFMLLKVKNDGYYIVEQENNNDTEQ